MASDRVVYDVGSGRCSFWSARAGTADERPFVTIAQPRRFEFQGVKYSRVECKRTALWCRHSAELLGESDEKPFRTADVAEPIRVFILDHFAHELRAALAEPLKRLVDVVHGEHDA
jgi:hypothetical protein